MHASRIALTMAGFAALGRSQSTISIPVPTSVPSDASQAVDHSFLGFGVETASWPDYAGNLTSPNLFSRNLVESLTNKTGKGTIIRVGGTSGDHATYVSSQVEAVIRPPSQVGLNVPWGITIGSTYFEGYSNFPGNKYTVMVPMAPVKNGNLTNSIDQTQAAIAGMGGLSSLESLELGNEPNAYPGVDRPSDYSPANYSTEWLQYTPELISALGLPEGPTQQALAIGSDAPAEWNVRNPFGDGLTEHGTVKTVSMHFYQGYAGDSLQDTLMNHTDTTSRFAHFLTPIAYLQENYPAIPFVLGEVGSDLNPTPRVNDNALEAAFGSTLWTVDFMLYAMSKNVSAISMQQGTGFGYAAWQPIAYNGLGPHVRGPYYGLACVADFIGTAAADLQVSNIDLSSATLSAYAGYIAGRLAKVAIVNLAYYNASSSSSSSSSSEAARPTQPVTFAVPAAVAAVRVDHLVGPDSSAPTGIYWAGVSWTIAALGRGTLVRNDTQTLDVVDGLVTLTLDASEAVIVTML